MPPRGTCAPCRPPLASLDAPPGRPMPTRGLVGCTTCKKYMSVSGVLIRLELNVPAQYPDGYELLHHSSMGKLFPSECAGPVFDSDPSRLRAPSRSGRNIILAQSLFKGNRASSSRTLLFFSFFFFFLVAFAPLVFASRLCASHLCVSPLRLSSLRLAFAPLSSLRLAFTAPPLRLAVCASPLFPLGHLFDFSAGISLCTFSGAALATPIMRAILPLRTMR